MRYKLRSHDGGLPGGFMFKQQGPDGKMQTFPAQPIIEAQAHAVARWRAGNSMARSSIAEALQDVDCYQCQRLGNNPSFCIPANAADAATGNSNPYIAPPTGCAGCGITFKQTE
jgi:hypothetical protein